MLKVGPCNCNVCRVPAPPQSWQFQHSAPAPVPDSERAVPITASSAYEDNCNLVGEVCICVIMPAFCLREIFQGVRVEWHVEDDGCSFDIDESLLEMKELVRRFGNPPVQVKGLS